MYNGIGITKVRGSGTSGHVQKSLASVRPQTFDKSVIQKKKTVVIPPDDVLEDHDKKRALELEVQKWARENKIREKFKPEEALEKIRVKREELRGKRSGGSDVSQEKATVTDDRLKKRAKRQPGEEKEEGEIVEEEEAEEAK